MPPSFICLAALQHCCRTAAAVLLDLGQFALLAAHSRRTLAAENLFLRKQLALFQEREAKPRRADGATRWMMATLSWCFAWRGALVNVKPSRVTPSKRKAPRPSALLPPPVIRCRASCWPGFSCPRTRKSSSIV